MTISCKALGIEVGLSESRVALLRRRGESDESIRSGSYRRPPGRIPRGSTDPESLSSRLRAAGVQPGTYWNRKRRGLPEAECWRTDVPRGRPRKVEKS